MESLPKIPGYRWRVMHPSDAQWLYQFELDCSKVDGNTHLTPLSEWENRLSDENYLQLNSIVLSDEIKHIIARGLILYQDEVHDVQAFLHGRVHPDYRGKGIGERLLTWMERQAKNQLNTIARRRKLVLRILFYDRNEDAISLFVKLGYRFQYTEEELEFNLQKIPPDFQLPDKMKINHWKSENANDFYRAYQVSFATRTKMLMEETAWRHHFANPNDDGFLQDLSILVTRENQAIAFAVCHSEELQIDQNSRIVWITQMGVHSKWRNQGIGSALLSDLLRRFINYDFQMAKLSVNIDNPGAKALYEKVGFKLCKRFTLYRKEIEG